MKDFCVVCDGERKEPFCDCEHTGDPFDWTDFSQTDCKGLYDSAVLKVVATAAEEEGSWTPYEMTMTEMTAALALVPYQLFEDDCYTYDCTYCYT